MKTYKVGYKEHDKPRIYYATTKAHSIGAVFLQNTQVNILTVVRV